jgi:hypothetical protein
MLIPQFLGVRLKWINKDGADITSTVTNPAGFTLVDANYGKKWEDLKASDWPSTYQSPIYPNVFAAGIAFAPQGLFQNHTLRKMELLFPLLLLVQGWHPVLLVKWLL